MGCSGLYVSIAHSDAVWGVSWTQNDTAISVSADGSVKQWSAIAGQPHPPNASFPKPHTLAQVSLSVSPDAKRAIYNSIEGLTTLWNLENGEVIGTFESFARSSADTEPCEHLSPWFWERRFKWLFLSKPGRSLCIPKEKHMPLQVAQETFPFILHSQIISGRSFQLCLQVGRSLACIVRMFVSISFPLL